MFGCAAPHGPPVDQTEPIERQRTQMDVLGDRQVAHRGQLLMHHADARLPRIARRSKMHGLPVQAHLALIPGMHAGNDLHQRRLAGAVLADQPVDLAGQQREVHVT